METEGTYRNDQDTTKDTGHHDEDTSTEHDKEQVLSPCWNTRLPEQLFPSQRMGFRSE